MYVPRAPLHADVTLCTHNRGTFSMHAGAKAEVKHTPVIARATEEEIDSDMTLLMETELRDFINSSDVEPEPQAGDDD